jgi:hypothetical protein
LSIKPCVAKFHRLVKLAIVLTDDLWLCLMIEELFDRIELDYNRFIAMLEAYAMVKLKKTHTLGSVG